LEFGVWSFSFCEGGRIIQLMQPFLKTSTLYPQKAVKSDAAGQKWYKNQLSITFV
jgi:hypothetical protein